MLTDKNQLLTTKVYSTGKKSFLTQLLVLRFITKLRHQANNINIHSIKQEHLNYVNDPTLITSSYNYQGNGLRKLIKLNTQNKKNIFILFFRRINKHFQVLIEILKNLSQLHPNYFLSFEILIALITLEQFFYISLSITFQIELSIIFNIFCYTILILDIILKLISSNNDHPSYDQKTNCIDKIIIEQCIAALTLLPQILNFIIDNKIINYSRVIFYYRVQSVSSVFGKIEYQMSDFKQNFLQLFKLSLTLITAAHIIGCFWYILAYETKEDNWIIQYFNVLPNQIDTLTLYISSLYWSITTMLTVGYGDILPVNDNEKIYAIGTMLIGCCLFGYIMNSIGSIFDHINNNEKVLRQEMQKLNNFLDSKRIDEKLKSKFRKYLEHYHLKKQSHQLMDRSNVQNVSEELMHEFNHQMLKHFLKENFILSKFESPVIYKLSKCLKESQFLPDELIYEKSNQQINLYLILTGTVIEVFQRNNQEDIQTYKNNQCFGEIDFIAGYRIQCLFISQAFTYIFMLERNEFFQIVKEANYFDYLKLCYAKDLITLSKDYKYFSRVCPACFKNDHLLYTCPQIHYYPNIIRIIFQNSVQQRSKIYLRKQIKTRNTLAYLQDIQTEAVVYLDENQSFLGLKSEEIISDSSSEKSINLTQEFNSDQFIIEQDPTSQDDAPFEIKVNQQNYQLQGRSQLELDEYKQNISSKINQEQVDQYRIQRQQKLLSNKQIPSTNNSQGEQQFSILDIDKMYQYQDYFPMSNFNIVIQQINKITQN